MKRERLPIRHFTLMSGNYFIIFKIKQKVEQEISRWEGKQATVTWSERKIQTRLSELSNIFIS